MSNILRVSPATPSSPNRAKLSREKRPRDPILRLREQRPREKVYAAVQKALVPLKPSANVLKQTMLVECNTDSDLRAIAVAEGKRKLSHGMDLSTFTFSGHGPWFFGHPT